LPPPVISTGDSCADAIAAANAAIETLTKPFYGNAVRRRSSGRIADLID
jgi:hypothetical protein